MELFVAVGVVIASEGASDRKAAIVEQGEGDGVNDGFFRRVLVVGSEVDDDSLGFGFAAACLAEGTSKICSARCKEIVALDDEGIGSVVRPSVVAEVPRIAVRVISNSGGHVHRLPQTAMTAATTLSGVRSR
jgi:hypothetical protein